MRMNIAAVVVAALGIVGSAAAQTRTLDLTPVGISVRGGVVLPFDSTLENLGNSLIGLGVEYTLSRPLLQGGETFLALDYFTPRIGGEKGSVFPLTINQRWYNNPEDARRTYYFAGIGAAFIDVNNSRAALAARGGIGFELGDRIFTEVAGTISDKAGGARANSLGLWLGYRF